MTFAQHKDIDTEVTCLTICYKTHL